MSTPLHDRPYSLLLLGATGYTGELTASYIASHLPTSLRWAIAGRSESKLRQLCDQLVRLAPDRVPPAIELVHDLADEAEMRALARRTGVLVSCVGPYTVLGETVVKAVVEEGGGYLDCTGEVPWHKEMIEKYEARAKETGAVLIPQCGVDSVPADIICVTLARHIQRQHHVPATHVASCLHAFKAEASGGTASTVLTLFDTYSPTQLAKLMAQYGLCDKKAKPQIPPGKPLSSLLTGLHSIPYLGSALVRSFQSGMDVPLVHRSWSLLTTQAQRNSNSSSSSAATTLENPGFSPDRFVFEEYLRPRNALLGCLTHWALTLGTLLLLLPPIRWLARRWIHAPGTGPSEEESRAHFLDVRAVGFAQGEQALARARLFYRGSLYALTGLTLGEAARVLMHMLETGEGALPGGFWTPACLGERYVEGCVSAGVRLEVEDL